MSRRAAPRPPPSSEIDPLALLPSPSRPSSSARRTAPKRPPLDLSEDEGEAIQVRTRVVVEAPEVRSVKRRKVEVEEEGKGVQVTRGVPGFGGRGGRTANGGGGGKPASPVVNGVGNVKAVVSPVINGNGSGRVTRTSQTVEVMIDRPATRRTPTTTTSPSPSPTKPRAQPQPKASTSKPTTPSKLKNPPITPTKPRLPSPTPSSSSSSSEEPTTTPVLSSSRFRQNESARKAKEARNYVPSQDELGGARRTRGGRVFGPAEGEEEEDEGRERRRVEKGKGKVVDEDGDVEMEEEGDGDEVDEEMEVVDPFEGMEGMDLDEEISAPFPVPEDPLMDDTSDSVIPNGILHAKSRPESAQPLSLTPSFQSYLHRILHNLSSPPTSSPPPFILPRAVAPASAGAAELQQLGMSESEQGNEALMSLWRLLRGTVERGEGNSCLVLGAKGSGKTRTVNRVLSLLTSHFAPLPTPFSRAGKGKQAAKREDKRPVIVRLDGLAQTNDALAIREMGRQIGEAEGVVLGEEEEDGEGVEDIAPTTLPAHLLALLTKPSSRAVVVVIENFDLFTEHARQALLYCLLDVVQSVRTGPVDTTGRGVAVVGVTSQVNTQLLLEKRVKSRFSQRVFRVVSPLSGDRMSADSGGNMPIWEELVREAICPEVEGEAEWRADWVERVDEVLVDEDVRRALRRLCELTTDVRLLLRAFYHPILHTLHTSSPPSSALITSSITSQTQLSGWGLKLSKLRTLSHPALVILILAKGLAWRERMEFNFAMMTAEYETSWRKEISGKGKGKWGVEVLKIAWDRLISLGILFPASRLRSSTNPWMHQFIMHRCALAKHEILGFFKDESMNGGKTGAGGLGTEWMTLAKRAGAN